MSDQPTSPKQIPSLTIKPHVRPDFSKYPGPQAKPAQQKEGLEQNQAQPEQDQESVHQVETPQETVPELDQLLAQLHGLIGLAGAKQQIDRLIRFVEVQKLRIAQGLSTRKLALHCVFSGNPGTGKTTIARIFGKILKCLHILEKGHLVETDRTGLVANYVGQTANKTDEKIAEAMGGVLFIDEAYALAKGDGHSWDYGSEAIEVLVKRMEDFRENLVVIVAGYQQPMEDFLNSNEGLKSRFSNFVHFEDYNMEELLAIFKGFLETDRYQLDEGSEALVCEIISLELAGKDVSFGNGRYARNLFEEVIRHQAARLSHAVRRPDGQLDLVTICREDVAPVWEATQKKMAERRQQNPIGFGR